VIPALEQDGVEVRKLMKAKTDPSDTTLSAIVD
jgi:hypothetical protein